MEDTTTKSAEQQILDEIEKQNTTVAWLAGQVFVTPPHLHYVLKGKPGEKRVLSDKLLEQINSVLKTEIKK